MKSKNIKTEKSKIVIGIVFSLALICMIALLMVPSYAWLTGNRSVAVVGRIDTPMSLQISAANKEKLEYLDFSSIDLTKGKEYPGGKHYQDFVFTVYGEAVHVFKLQLAYTTNNQFEYELYNAVEANSHTPGAASYTSVSDAGIKYYYVTSSAVTMIPLNKADNAMLGVTDGAIDNTTGSGLYTSTYHNSYEDGYVNKYAVPVYMQTEVITADRVQDKFLNNFILRVIWNWSPDITNDKETDIIYIAATVIE